MIKSCWKDIQILYYKYLRLWKYIIQAYLTWRNENLKFKIHAREVANRSGVNDD